MSVLLSTIAFAPAFPARDAGASVSGTIQANVMSPDSSCKPGDICASIKMPNPRNGCYFNNVYTSSKGGTPLTMDITETGSNGSPVYIYWVNATNKTISIKNSASANYYCPRK